LTTPPKKEKAEATAEATEKPVMNAKSPRAEGKSPKKKAASKKEKKSEE
jgi:hypothetical protein